ncbi:putative hydrolase (HAD superfamily) [Rhodovulum sp. P5]|uniref:hypothetical protein n=1 Tax=Rhodovulum sp. P5 TaxID=1564506 RepID=UPI0009C24895|nr:hypothetical protein [Rhodovulum sp. P5]ARE41124.1 putative hydrolase (HAD superfamily) [Rhodovulum sp. P5]
MDAEGMGSGAAEMTERGARRIRRVLLCGDLLATRESEQASNLRWVADLLARPTGVALGGADAVQVGLDAWAFSRAAFFAAAGHRVDLAARHAWFDAEALPPQALALLRDAVGPETLVVGYELSGATRQALRRANIPFVDIWLHPVRFADDILFAMRASDPDIQARIARFAVPEESLAAQADLLKIQNYRGFSRFDRRLIDGAGLFVGQTPRDKALMDRDRFVDLMDFADDFAALARDVPHIYYVRHPHVVRPDREIETFLKGFRNVSEIAAPTYHLLADPRIGVVAGLSSSVLEEARHFGKAVRCLFRPPIPLRGGEAYATIFQSLCFSGFWADILSGVSDVADCPPAQFLDPKNKLRHVLSFYWGYPQIDRYEHSLTDPVQSEASEVAGVTLETAALVSFDVFDTLITRSYAAPRDVFRAIAPRLSGPLGMAAEEFPDRRVLAEKAATRKVARSGREDPTIFEVYAELADRPPTDPLIRELAEIEIAEEMSCLKVRPAGQALYHAARAAGRRIVLMSDMYLPADVVEGMLRQAGYDGWSALFLSSARGKTKRSGTLFEVMMAETGVAAGQILHVGDNPRGDLAVPEGLGITCRPLPKPVETMAQAAPFLKTATGRIAASDDLAASRMLQHLALQFFDDPPGGSDPFGGDPRRFGHVVLGPLLTGFAAWLHDMATADGVTRLGFLTREGPVFRAAYDALFPDGPVATVDVIASRRIVRLAALTSEAEIEVAYRASRARDYGSLADYLSVNFGLDREEIDLDAVAAAGLPGPDVAIGAATPEDLLRDLVVAHRGPIMAGAGCARALLTDHLRDRGLDGPDCAVVDIGYAGSMQAAFSDILGTPLRGYYMARFRTASDRLGTIPARGWLVEDVAATDRGHGICRHRHVYETLLCAPGATFVGLLRDASGWRGVPAADRQTPLRDAFVAEAHRGAVDFAHAMAAQSETVPRLSAEVATALLDTCLDQPGPALAGWIGALEFEDAFARPGIVPLSGAASSAGSPIWPEAAEALNTAQRPRRKRGHRPAWRPYGPYGLLGWRHLLPVFVAPVIGRIGDAHDVDHYLEDPIGFFRRLSDPRYRRIGRILYPWD